MLYPLGPLPTDLVTATVPSTSSIAAGNAENAVLFMRHCRTVKRIPSPVKDCRKFEFEIGGQAYELERVHSNRDAHAHVHYNLIRVGFICAT